MPDLTIAIAGNPNCGKTTLFNALTGTRQQVGNWPGVTVERKVGRFTHAGRSVTLVDLPGVYTLGVSDGGTGLDERIARDYLVSQRPDLVINVLDAANLERNLYLTVQLLEMAVPMVVALNMMDRARARRIEIDIDALAAQLGCPVVPIEAADRTGLIALTDAAIEAATRPGARPVAPSLGSEVDAAIDRLEPVIAGASGTAAPRWLALKLLEGDALCPAMMDPALAGPVAETRAALEAATEMDADTAIACGRYDAVAGLTGRCMTHPGELGLSLSARLDRVVLNRVLGIPIFLLIMYLMFMLTINFGGAFIDFFDILAGTLAVDAPAALLSAIGAPDAVTTLVTTGIGGGIRTVATFVPIVGMLFLVLSALEESGYMARAAFVMDRFMRMLGLPGKSFVPLIVGFGCNVPAILATRTLENQRDRTVTVMMAPFMSCGARLPVYALFAAAFFPTHGQNLVFLLYLIGLAAAVGTGLILRKTLLQGPSEPFVMEMPPYRLPEPRELILRAWTRLKAFLLGAGRVIVVMVTVLSALSAVGTDGRFGSTTPDSSILASMGRGLTPVFAPIGIEKDNWPATVGIFAGILAKEAVVGTLDTLYRGVSETGATDQEQLSISAGVKAAFATIGPNLRDAFGMARDPLGIDIGPVGDRDAAAGAQGVQARTFGTMAALFDGRVGAFAYLLVILLYMPCAATLGAIWRETSPGWALFAGGWTLGLGYGSAVLFYQAATFAAHPLGSSLWIGSILALFAGVTTLMRRAGARSDAVAAPAVLAE